MKNHFFNIPKKKPLQPNEKAGDVEQKIRSEEFFSKNKNLLMPTLLNFKIKTSNKNRS